MKIKHIKIIKTINEKISGICVENEGHRSASG
jgi:hypothetical protein